MSTAPRPPLLAFGLTDPAPEILRHVVSETPDPVAEDAARRPSLLAFGLADQLAGVMLPSFGTETRQAPGRARPGALVS